MHAAQRLNRISNRVETGDWASAENYPAENQTNPREGGMPQLFSSLVIVALEEWEDLRERPVGMGWGGKGDGGCFLI